MNERQHRLKQLFERSIIEEAFPNPSVSWTVQKIERSDGPMSMCIADWIDIEFGTTEQRTIAVPNHVSDLHSASSDAEGSAMYSAEELDDFNAYETSFASPRISRTAARRIAGKPVPRGVLVRAMYLALADFHANPDGQIVTLDSTDTRKESTAMSGAEVKALRIRVRRQLEGWAIADGEITVRRASELDRYAAILSPRPQGDQDGDDTETHLPSVI